MIPLRPEKTRKAFVNQCQTPSTSARMIGVRHRDGEVAATDDVAAAAGQVFVYSGPEPPSGGVRRPPLAVIAPH